MSALIFRIWFQANLLFPVLLLAINNGYSLRHFEWTDLGWFIPLYFGLLVFTTIPVLLLVFISDLIESTALVPKAKFISLLVCFSLVIMPLFFGTLSLFTGDFGFWFVSKEGLSVTLPAILAGIIPSLFAHRKFIQEFSLAGTQPAGSAPSQSTYK